MKPHSVDLVSNVFYAALMTNTISMLIIGNEILDGRTLDTNSCYFGEVLEQNDFKLSKKIAVSDDIQEILSALKYLCRDSDAIIVSGGLGPTSDDMTREAISEFTGKELVLDEQDLYRLRSFYTSRKREFPEANRTQAFYPAGATIINNPVGSAAGFSVEAQETLIMCVPGVPRELIAMIEETVIPNLRERFPERTQKRKISFRTFEMPESKAAGIITGCKLPESVEVSYRAHFPELGIQLTAKNNEVDLNEWHEKVASKLGKEYIYTQETNETLPETVAGTLSQSGKTIAFAESCTGGLISKLLTDISGSSSYFLGSAVTYSNESKSELVSVSKDILMQHGAVSHEVAKEMAAGARKRFSSDIALSVTGIAGPSGGTENKPVGTYFVGLATESINTSLHFYFSGQRELIRIKAAYNVLDTTRRFLLGLPYTALGVLEH